MAAQTGSLRARIAAAAARAGRNPDSITVVAVSKGHPPEAIAAARDLGIHDVGESYLQEALNKLTALEALSGQPGHARLHWHFIGRLQSNKTRDIAAHFDWVHGLDRSSIARRLNEQRPFHAAPLNVCLQVKLADEAAKGGVTPEQLPALAAEVTALQRLRLRGLMCLPPETDDAALQRQVFRQLSDLLRTMNAQGHRMDTLSMGMSGDFEIAIEEGATHIRIGTALFGPRDPGGGEPGNGLGDEPGAKNG